MMGYIFAGGLALLLVLAGWQTVMRQPRRFRLRLARYSVGGILGILTIVLAIMRRIDLAFFTGAGAFAVLARGRLGPISFESNEIDSDNVSRVRSRYFEMELDHDTGLVTGNIVSGQFAGADLIDLDEHQTRALIDEVSGDSDSISLLESWLDANRAGWREYFAQNMGGGHDPDSAADPISEAYAVLGLDPGADADAVRAAHRSLMRGVHPDHGGSAYLAARINGARDRLLAHLGADK